MVVVAVRLVLLLPLSLDPAAPAPPLPLWTQFATLRPSRQVSMSWRSSSEIAATLFFSIVSSVHALKGLFCLRTCSFSSSPPPDAISTKSGPPLARLISGPLRARATPEEDCGNACLVARRLLIAMTGFPAKTTASSPWCTPRPASAAPSGTPAGRSAPATPSAAASGAQRITRRTCTGSVRRAASSRCRT